MIVLHTSPQDCCVDHHHHGHPHHQDLEKIKVLQNFKVCQEVCLLIIIYNEFYWVDILLSVGFQKYVFSFL
jgi:hypothetical protein